MTDKYELDELSLAHAEASLDLYTSDDTEYAKPLERAQVYALVSIAESLHTLTKFLIEKEEGTR